MQEREGGTKMQPPRLGRAAGRGADLPYDTPLTNADLFREAGIDQTEQAALLRKVFDKCNQQLTATRTIAFHHQGQILYSKKLPDNMAIARAIEHGMDLSGLSKKDSPQIQVEVHVVLPAFMTGASIPRPPMLEGQGTVETVPLAPQSTMLEVRVEPTRSTQASQE